MQRLAHVLLVVAVVAQAECSQTSSNPVVVTPSSLVVVDDADAVAWEGGLIWLAAQPVNPALTLDPSVVATSLVAAFTPAGCVSPGVNINVVTLQLSDCAGPFGINHATGSVSFTFTQRGGMAQIVTTASNLQIGGGSLSINATGVLAANGLELAVTTSGGGFGPNGSSVEREGQYTLSWNSGDTCASVNGSVAAGGVNSETTMFSGFVVCTTGCPRGGTVTAVEPATGSTFTTNYDGTSSATVVGSNGTQTVTMLSCS